MATELPAPAKRGRPKGSGGGTAGTPTDPLERRLAAALSRLDDSLELEKLLANKTAERIKKNLATAEETGTEVNEERLFDWRDRNAKIARIFSLAASALTKPRKEKQEDDDGEAGVDDKQIEKMLMGGGKNK